jgi:phage tail-like protein
MAAKDSVPILGTNFVLNLDGMPKFPLLSVSLAGLEAAKIEEFSIDAKGDMFKRVAVGVPKNAQITVSRAFLADDPNAMKLYDWHKKAFTAGYEDAIRDGSIDGYDTRNKLLSSFHFENAWPKTYTWPGLDAKGGSFLVEQITLSCDYWWREK